MVVRKKISDPGPAPGPLDEALAYRIYHVARQLRFNLLQTFRSIEREITPEQWFVLYRLWERDGQAQVELSSRIFEDRPNITRIVNALQKAEMVERRSDSEDGRRQLVYLTENGRAVLAQVAPLIRESRESLFAGIEDEELATVRRVLSKIEANLDDTRLP